MNTVLMLATALQYKCDAASSFVALDVMDCDIMGHGQLLAVSY
jgi:hypothetical protein